MHKNIYTVHVNMKAHIVIVHCSSQLIMLKHWPFIFSIAQKYLF